MICRHCKESITFDASGWWRVEFAASPFYCASAPEPDPTQTARKAHFPDLNQPGALEEYLG